MVDQVYWVPVVVKIQEQGFENLADFSVGRSDPSQSRLMLEGEGARHGTRCHEWHIPVLREVVDTVGG